MQGVDESGCESWAASVPCTYSFVYKRAAIEASEGCISLVLFEASQELTVHENSAKKARRGIKRVWSVSKTSQMGGVGYHEQFNSMGR